MDNDEVFAFAVSGILAIAFVVRWYGPLFSVRSLIGPLSLRIPLFLTPPICITFLTFVLMNFADHAVRENTGYIALFATMGAACFGATHLFLTIIGISPRDDALERRNGPATLAVCASLAAVTICFAGANIGEGPTIWTTIGPAITGIAAMFLCMITHALISRSSATITIDRDLPAALRAAGFFLGIGLIFGAAVAGDWVSIEAMWTDFAARAWPALVLLIAACIVDRIFKPTYTNAKFILITRGVAPVGIYLLIGLIDVAALAARGHR